MNFLDLAQVTTLDTQSTTSSSNASILSRPLGSIACAKNVITYGKGLKKVKKGMMNHKFYFCLHSYKCQRFMLMFMFDF